MGGLSDNIKGSALMVLALTAFTVNDAFMKALSDDVPLNQALVLRGIGTTVLLALYARATGVLRLPPDRRDRRIILFRTATDIAAAWCFLTAIFNMPIANASAIVQALPLTVTLAGALVFGERVGIRRLAAIGVGFLGVLLIVRPGAADFNVYSVYALASVLLFTVRDLAARSVSGAVPSVLIAFAGSLGVTAFFGAGAMFSDWVPLGPAQAMSLAGATVTVIGGYVLSVAAMRVGEVGAVAPFRYSSLLVALLLGVTVFGERPDALMLAGAAVVVASGLFTLYRERKLRQPRF